MVACCLTMRKVGDGGGYEEDLGCRTEVKARKD